MGQNQQTPKDNFDDLWKPDNNLQSLSTNYNHTLAFIQTELAFYKKEREYSRLGSKIIKLLTLIIIVVATSLPLFNSLSGLDDKEKLTRATWGYVLLSIAGSLFLCDKYLGFTSKWIRLKSAELNFSIARSNFIQDWIIFLATVNGQFTKELYIEGQKKISDFREKIDEIKKNEAQDWLKDYQQTMTDLSGKIDKMNQQAATDQQALIDQQKTSALIIKITNTQKFDLVKIKLDNEKVREVEKISEVLIENLAPKRYSLNVIGISAEKEHSFDKIIEISSKAALTESVTIPE